MDKKLAATCILLSALLGGVTAAYADSDADRSHPKAFMKDSEITTQIKAKLAADKEVSAIHIKVDTDDNGVVRLSGEARSRMEAEKAVSIARHVDGVKSVVDHIEIVSSR